MTAASPTNRSGKTLGTSQPAASSVLSPLVDCVTVTAGPGGLSENAPLVFCQSHDLSPLIPLRFAGRPRPWEKQQVSVLPSRGRAGRRRPSQLGGPTAPPGRVSHTHTRPACFNASSDTLSGTGSGLARSWEGETAAGSADSRSALRAHTRHFPSLRLSFPVFEAETMYVVPTCLTSCWGS